MKKGLLSLVFISIALSIFVISFVSADFEDDIRSLGGGIGSILRVIFEQILGAGVTLSDGDIFVRTLLLVIIFAVIWTTLKNINMFSDKEWVAVVIAVAVSILSMRVVGDKEWLEAILLPYSTLGVAIAAGIPFVIYFIVVEKSITVIPARRIAWIFFAVIFIGLYYVRLNDLGGFRSAATYIYLVTALLAFGMAVFDGTLQDFRNKVRREKASKSFKGTALLNLERNLQSVHDLYSQMGSGYVGVTPQGMAAGSGDAAYRADVKAFERRIKLLMK